MCIIIDNNVAYCFKQPVSDAAARIVRWLTKERGSVALCKELWRELRANSAMRDLITELRRVGRVHQVTDADMEAARNALSGFNNKSNDVHVLCVGYITCATVLFSEDTLLHEDWKALPIDVGRRRVYRYAEHEALLRTARCK